MFIFLSGEMIMPDQNHVAIVKQGTEAINKWRQNNPKDKLNLENARLNGIWLYKADLSEANLKGAILERANLAETNLTGCDLSKGNFSDAVLVKAKIKNANASRAFFINSNLHDVDLTGSNLFACNFFSASLFGANLSKVNLSEAVMNLSDLSLTTLFKTNFSKAKMYNASFFGSEMEKTIFQNTILSGAEFLNSNFIKVNFENVKIKNTIFANVNLNQLLKLSETVHLGPSHVDFFTLSITFSANSDNFNSNVKEFLLDTGLSPELLKELPRILSKKKYYDAFVCYGNPDKNHAEKIVTDLRKHGVSCWLYSLDATVGKRTWNEIKFQRQKADKMIVLCSAPSLLRDGALKEIEEQIDEDPDKIIPISFDNTWKEENFKVKRGSYDLKPFLLDKNYADFSNLTIYERSLNKLLRGLEKTEK